MAQSTRPRASNVPRNMTLKLLGNSDASTDGRSDVVVAVDQVAVTMPTVTEMARTIAEIDRAGSVDVAVAYEPRCVRSLSGTLEESLVDYHLKRLGVIRGRPGIGFPAAVHLERCAAPARVLVTDSPYMTMLGGLGTLALVATQLQLADALSKGQIRIPSPYVLQVILSGRLCASVSARDITLELLRLGLPQQVSSISCSQAHPVIIEFAGPGIRTMSVSERAVLCSIAADVGAASALCACDEKTDQFLRDQRRSKAYRQLTPDAGAPCAEALCLDLSTVVPLVALGTGAIVPVPDAAQLPIREVVIAGGATGGLRDLLNASVWFKTKRISSDVDVVISPATHQALQAIAANGTLAQLLSVGARLVEPDCRLLTGEWQPPPNQGQSLRSYVRHAGPTVGEANWNVASLDTLCMSAISGTIQDPRAGRKTPKISMPRDLPIDDSLLFDKRPTTATTMLPPPRSTPASDPPQSNPNLAEGAPSNDDIPRHHRLSELGFDGSN